MAENNPGSAAPIESPPAASALREPQDGADPRHALHRLVNQLKQNRNRKLLTEYLLMRRAIR